jgi:hypothetical protein
MNPITNLAFEIHVPSSVSPSSFLVLSDAATVEVAWSCLWVYVVGTVEVARRRVGPETALVQVPTCEQQQVENESDNI